MLFFVGAVAVYAEKPLQEYRQCPLGDTETYREAGECGLWNNMLVSTLELSLEKQNTHTVGRYRGDRSLSRAWIPDSSTDAGVTDHA